MQHLKIKRIGDHGLPLPAQETELAAGYDLRAASDTHIPSLRRCIVNTGFAVEIPSGYVGLICPRSGLAAKEGITVLNAPGVIDADYRGELKVIIHNTDPSEGVSIFAGQRIAQLVIVPCLHLPMQEVEELDDTERGEGGLGSTGVK